MSKIRDSYHSKCTLIFFPTSGLTKRINLDDKQILEFENSFPLDSQRLCPKLIRNIHISRSIDPPISRELDWTTDLWLIYDQEWKVRLNLIFSIQIGGTIILTNGYIAFSRLVFQVSVNHPSSYFSRWMKQKIHPHVKDPQDVF